MNIQEVKRISKVSKKEQWPYPRTFQALIDAGVTSYRTEVANNLTVYFGDGDRYEDEHSFLLDKLSIAEKFQADEVKRGLEHHQKNLTPYTDFLKDLAKSGVRYYLVDMAGRMITYTSGRSEESYVESIPLFK